MPSGQAGDPIRIVIDEASFDFRGLSSALIEDHLDSFNDVVKDLRRDGFAPRKPPMMEDAPCTDESDLVAYLMGEPGRAIDRDTRTRFFSLIDKCLEWDSSAPIATEVMVGGDEPQMALSIAFALMNVLRGHGVACLVFGVCTRRGFLPVGDTTDRADIFFFAANDSIKHFWRSLYELEKIPESEFLALAGRSFPDLDLHPGLTFRHFDGTYQGLMPDVVRHLSILNDHFMKAFRDCNGIPHAVEAALAALGCAGVSPESPNTRRNESIMRLRDVTYRGRTIRCEWHTKIQLHRNRIHFAPGTDYDPAGKRIFIGIFTGHLDTGRRKG